VLSISRRFAESFVLECRIRVYDNLNLITFTVSEPREVHRQMCVLKLAVMFKE
jgi:hypothetical protein